MKHLLMVACLAAGCADASVQEQGRRLELRTTTTRKKDETLVTATLRNRGSEPVHVLHEFMLSRTSATLIDDRGNKLVAHEASAVRGARAFQMGKIKTHRLLPGEQVEVETFSLLPAVRRAHAGDFSWELDDVRSKTLTLEMAYEVTEDAAKTAKHHQAPDVAVGRWTSKPVVLPYRN